MLRIFIAAILVLGPVLFYAPPSTAQSDAAAPSCPCTLRGSVVNSVSGQPIHRVLVQISGVPTKATLTDPEGNFQFDNLPAGPVTLLAEKPGFLGRDSSSPQSSILESFHLAPDSPPAILRLTPESIISGQVSDENGEALEGFTVTILFRNPADGRLFPDPRHRAVTDDEGKFRMAGLHPASYFLVVRQTQGPILNSPRKSAPPLGYSPVFYPGVGDFSSAVPLRLSPGKTTQANFALKREPFVQLSGTVSGPDPHEGVLLVLEGSLGSLENSEVTFDPATRSFRTKWIPPGNYTLVGQSNGALTIAETEDSKIVALTAASSVDRLVRRLPAPFIGSLSIQASSSLSSLHLVLQPTVDIPVDMRGFPSTKPEDLQSPPFGLGLESRQSVTQGLDRSASTDPQQSGSSDDLHFIFAGVAPGNYELVFEPSPGSTAYVESATWGSTDLLHSNLVLDSSGSIPPIEVVVREDGATLNGIVSSGDLPALVILLSDKRRKPQLVPVGPDGRFEVSGLAPGAYRVFAADISSGFDFTDPSFLQRISSKIQEVTLAPKQSASLDLSVAMEEE